VREIKKINDYISLSRVDEVQNTSSYNVNEEVNSLSLYINLGEKSRYSSYIDKFAGKSEKNHTVLQLFNRFNGQIELLNKQRKFIAIKVQKEYLSKILPLNKKSQKVFEFFESTKSAQDISYKKTKPKTSLFAKDLLYNKYEGKLESLYLESKVLNLLYLEFKDIFQEDSTKVKDLVKISKQDEEAIYYARDILSTNIENPPSIKELAKIVTLNEFKLKYGFSKIFNQTPYNLSLEYRLQEAKKLLESSEYNINEISQKIGYKYVQSFSKAFHKYFGVRPKDIMKKRKYYY